eukprot:TRINITY_DN26384_c0_g6_i2.p1 TRINITY_DN26384_c0_g6~~TRINITY_DN26384_c0_g6_i2.p1  ORF type:complete len:1061 (+),score=171.71 TRINITY_DN26384_c0_g6_i2:98-3184(+)
MAPRVRTSAMSPLALSLILCTLTSARAAGSSSSSSGVNSSGNSTAEVSHSEHPHYHDALLFPFLAVVVGIFFTHLSSRVHALQALPYTVYLFWLGVLVGFLNNMAGVSITGIFTDSIAMWVRIDPHLLLYTFLPVLLFGDSMGINFQVFKATFAQSAILAGPGVLLGTVAMYVVARYVLPYGWTTAEAAAFASILAATDPVAVVALLKEMGVNRMLTMQIMGESLLNDGIAMCMWSVFMQIILGKELTVWSTALQFLYTALGGTLVGVIFGLVALKWMSMASDKLNHADHIVQLSLTVAFAYLSFFLAERVLKVSGVLACVFTALMIGRAVWPLLCSEEGVSHVWHALEFFGNTILFMLCGLIFYNSSVSAGWQDYFYLLLIYTWAIISRGMMVFGLSPLLKFVSKGEASRTTWKECIVMTWGGLRGAVGLALAIATRNELVHSGQADPDTANLIVFHVGGVAGLTLLINATTCKAVLERLQLTARPSLRSTLVDSLRENLFDDAQERLSTTVVKDLCFSAVNVSYLTNVVTHATNVKDGHRHSVNNGFHAVMSVAQSESKARSKLDVSHVIPEEDEEELCVDDIPAKADADVPLQDNAKPEKQGSAVKFAITASDASTEVMAAGDSTPTGRLEKPSVSFMKAMASTNSMDKAIETKKPLQQMELLSVVNRAKNKFKKGNVNFREVSVKTSKTFRGMAMGKEESIAYAGERKMLKFDHGDSVNSAYSGEGTEGMEHRSTARLARVSLLKSQQALLRLATRKMSGSASEEGPYWWFGFKPVTRMYNAVTSLTLEWPARSDQEDVVIVRTLFLSMLRAEYARQTKRGMLPNACTGSSDLPKSVDLALDFADMQLHDWKHLIKDLVVRERRYWIGTVGHGELFAAIKMNDKDRVFDLFTVVAFIDAHHIVCQKFIDERPLDRRDAIDMVLEESVKEIEMAHCFLKEHSIGVQEIGFVRTKQLAVMALMRMKQQVDDWLSQGILVASEACEMTHDIQHEMHTVMHHKYEGSNTVGNGISIHSDPSNQSLETE